MRICTARRCLGDLTLALRIFQERDRGYQWPPDMLADALEIERRHIVYQRRRRYARQRAVHV